MGRFNSKIKSFVCIHLLTIFITAILIGETTLCAQAADNTIAWPSERVFLIQIMLLVLFGQLLGEAIQRIGQPAIMGQLIGGIMLGPSIFGVLWPELRHAIFPDTTDHKSILDTFSQFGVLMILLLAGMETDLSLARKVGRAAVSVSIAGIILPFALGFSLGEFLPHSFLPTQDQRLITAFF